MELFGVQLELEAIRDARAQWDKARRQFESDVEMLMARLLNEAAVNYMSVPQISRASGLTPTKVRALMRKHGLNPKHGKQRLATAAANALQENSALLGIEPHEMDLMSPLAYLPMGSELRQAIEDAAKMDRNEYTWTAEVSGNSLAAQEADYHESGAARFEALSNAIYMAMPWEGETYQAAADAIANAVLGHLGFCPKDWEPMPCLTCGAGS